MTAQQRVDINKCNWGTKIGPDEVHLQQLARYELLRGEDIRAKQEAVLARRAQIYANNSKL